jgi:hypothetical protein
MSISMNPLTEQSIRESFVNASRKELSDLTLPTGFDDVDWDRVDYFGWRDRRIARRAYVVIPVDGELVGIILHQAKASPGKRAQCSWCQDVHLPNDVVFFGARLAGVAGRNGDTAGTLACADFECSVNVRKKPPVAYIGFDVEAARTERIANLRQRVAGFAAAITG